MLTDIEKAFLCPTNATHRQYEALRAYFIDKLPSKEVAAKFGYSPGSFRVLCHEFRESPQHQFFLPERISPQTVKAPSQLLRSPMHQRVIALRKQNLSIYDIIRSLR